MYMAQRCWEHFLMNKLWTKCPTAGITLKYHTFIGVTYDLPVTFPQRWPRMCDRKHKAVRTWPKSDVTRHIPRGVLHSQLMGEHIFLSKHISMTLGSATHCSSARRWLEARKVRETLPPGVATVFHLLSPTAWLYMALCTGFVPSTIYRQTGILLAAHTGRPSRIGWAQAFRAEGRELDS